MTVVDNEQAAVRRRRAGAAVRRRDARRRGDRRAAAGLVLGSSPAARAAPSPASAAGRARTCAGRRCGCRRFRGRWRTRRGRTRPVPDARGRGGHAQRPDDDRHPSPLQAGPRRDALDDRRASTLDRRGAVPVDRRCGDDHRARRLVPRAQRGVGVRGRAASGRPEVPVDPAGAAGLGPEPGADARDPRARAAVRRPGSRRRQPPRRRPWPRVSSAARTRSTDCSTVSSAPRRRTSGCSGASYGASTPVKPDSVPARARA